MQLSDATRISIGSILLTVPTIQFEGTKPTRFIVLIIVGAIVLAASLLVLGLGLLFQ